MRVQSVTARRDKVSLSPARLPGRPQALALRNDPGTLRVYLLDQIAPKRSREIILADHGSSYGCTTGPTKTPIGPLTCAGPSNDKNAEWPAITTTGKPVAGRGVSQRLLSRVYRKGIGWQVVLPPWHGMWWLLSASGQPVPWAGTLTTTKVDGKSVLAEPYQTGIGWVSFPVYTFSGDSGYGASCSAHAACQRAWPSVLTSGSPGDHGVPASGIGETGLPGGVTQVTWNGQPLYLFSHEELIPLPNGSATAAGNGNGFKAFGGTFSLVMNP